MATPARWFDDFEERRRRAAEAEAGRRSAIRKIARLRLEGWRDARIRRRLRSALVVGSHALMLMAGLAISEGRGYNERRAGLRADIAATNEANLLLAEQLEIRDEILERYALSVYVWTEAGLLTDDYLAPEFAPFLPSCD